VQKPVTVMMGFLAIVVLGIVAWVQTPLQLLPSGFTPPFLYVHVPTLPGPPKDLEETIAIPLEEVFGTVRNVRQMRTSIRSGRVGVLLQFEEGTDMDLAYNQVRDRLDRSRGQLPDEVGQFFIWKYDPASEPVFWLGAAVPEGLEDRDLAHLLETRLVRRLERVPGVSQVELQGAPRRQIEIEVDEKRANGAGIGVYELINQLRQDNFAMSGGVVEEGGRRLPLRVVSRFEDLEEVRALPVGDGRMRLGDIAQVQWASPEDKTIFRVNGRPGVVVEIYKESEANTVAVCEAVREVVRSNDPELAGFAFVDFFDQGQHIEDSLENLEVTALWGAFFAVLVLFLFLRRGGITMVITLAIPVSLMITLIVMYFTGSSLNALSLMGLMLSVGMVVDNSIVVVENIQRVRMEGRSAVEAAVVGSGGVALAIVVATSTSIVVFLPLILMSGSQTLSFYLGKIGYPVCVALVASLGVGLVFIPLAATLRLGGAHKPPPRLRFLEKVEDAYGRLLDLCLRRRLDALLVGVAVFVSMFYPASHLKETDAEAGNPNDYRLFVSFPDTMSFEERDALLREAEVALVAHKEELGIANVLTRMGGGWGRAQLRAFLVPPDARATVDKGELVKQGKAVLPHAPGVEYTTSWGETGTTGAIQVSVRGPDSAKLAEIAEDLAWRLRHVEGVVSATPATDDEATQELHLRVDRELAWRRGLSPLVVGGTVDYAIRGRRLGDFHAPDREVAMQVISPKAQRSSLEALSNFALRDPAGGPGIPLGHVTQATVSSGYQGIDREDRSTLLNIEVVPADDDLVGLWGRIDEVVAGYDFPRGYSVSKGERFERLQQNTSERNFAVILAIVCVFLLMGVLFESFVLPFSIVVSIPFAFVGVYWTLFLTGTAFDVMAGVGLVILIGLVVNNAVVLVDLVNQNLREGMERREAIVDAGRRRLRPILMTALTTIFGLVPMAVGRSSLVGIPYAPLGRALIGGMVASTVLTLAVVPLCYTYFDDLSRWGAGLLGRLTGRGRG